MNRKHIVTIGMLLISVTALPIWAGASNCCGGGARRRSTTSPKTSQETTKKAQTTCPIMGGKVNKRLYVEHDGKKIYVCCKGCIEKVVKDPAKYVEQFESTGITLDKAQTTCPVMGGKINKAQYVDHEGKRIYVCCPGCIGKIKADPAKYIKKLEDAGIALDYVPEKKADKKKDDQGGHKGHSGHH